MRLPLILGVTFLAACEGQVPALRAPGAPAPLVNVEGRVVDQDGRGLAEVWVRLIDTTRLSGHVDKRGCGTYHPQQSVPTDGDGRFSASLPFQPNNVEVSGRLAWVELPSGMRGVSAGEPIVITARTIPHRTLSGLVVDAEGRPVPGASVMPESQGFGGRTDEQGRFELEASEPLPASFRARRMGYRPVVGSAGELQRIVLAQRRPMVTVTVLEPGGEPVNRLMSVSLWQNGARLSFCTAGDARLTHEPNTGICALDAEPGAVELQLDGKAVSTLEVSDAPLSVTVTAPVPAPSPVPSGLDGY
jgi:protocatechuate 3,4-dioxygenase beta subunit